MKNENLIVLQIKKKKYNSYKGKLSPEVPNSINRDFHSLKTNEKWLIDISEFSIPAGKVYLSPLVDCFDGGLDLCQVFRHIFVDILKLILFSYNHIGD